MSGKAQRVGTVIERGGKMKFQFKIQQFQTDAVAAVTDVFKGQPFKSASKYIRDLGEIQSDLGFEGGQKRLFGTFVADSDGEVFGFANEKVVVSKADLLANIRDIQTHNNLHTSEILEGHLGCCTLDVEMETGTGKTYVYTKTIYELNKKYGWSKFIIVVPSIAIREGVYKSLSVTEEHFMEQYGKKIKFSVYNSANLPDIDDFSTNHGICVMIINIQAFNAKGKDARKIRERLDSFGSRRPIDVIAGNRPILILDEPQKMGGKSTQDSLEDFNPLFCINYSATHKELHNCVYALDSVDAYQQRLVKRIELRSVEVKNLPGLNGYMYLSDFKLSPNEAPKARLEFEVSHKNGIKRETHLIGVGSNLYDKSGELAEYKGYVVSNIDPYYSTVSFTNGESVAMGDVAGDIAESDMRRIQIRETIRAHIEKERRMFNHGIKVLSLFFIDEVAKYRVYDEEGNEGIGEYGKIFEQEYIKLLNEYPNLFGTDDYLNYLHSIDVHKTHTGYFSIDKKGHSVDSSIKRGTDESDDISAYDLILRNKELLLSFDNPVRFIFSHSALREGWDNPNVFQICTLKPGSDNEVRTRQEVGRGLRLCVDKDGVRMDKEKLGEKVQDTNTLTVISTGSYEKIVKSLQEGIRDALHDRPSKADKEYFEGKTVIGADGFKVTISAEQANAIHRYLLKNDYVDDDDRITEKYTQDKDAGTLAALPEKLKPIEEGVFKLVDSVFNPSVLESMIENGNKAKCKDNPLNDNFGKAEFQALWKQINRKYIYLVDFDSEELIKKSVEAINAGLNVTKLKYTVTKVEQNKNMSQSDVKTDNVFTRGETRTAQANFDTDNDTKYDLVGEIAKKTSLTRRTSAQILYEIRNDKFGMYYHNPEEFIRKVSEFINEQKATVIVEHIQYNATEQVYDSDIFTEEKHNWNPKKAYIAKKNIQPYVFTDGVEGENNEWRFATELDTADEVCVYAKLPRGFQIPTPVGNYTPDWAIVFKEGTVKHIYFVAETKGSMDTLSLKGIEKAKRDCARKLFAKMADGNVKYDIVSSYQELYDIVAGE